MPQDLLDAAGPAAERIAGLGWMILIAFLLATVLVWALILWIALRRRGTLAEHAPVDLKTGQSWILVGGLLVPAAVLTVLYVVSLDTMAEFPLQAPAAAAPTIRVTGRQWWFEAEYLYRGEPSRRVSAPTEIHIPVGEPVDIELATRDVIHSFWVPKLHGKVDLVPGLTNRIRIQADAPGVYRGECAEFCGAQHAHMVIRVVAQPPARYQAWLATQRAPAAAPRSDQARRGREIFVNGPCALCHTVRGTPARGTIGPDLTHLASRGYIAGGMLKNNTANLEAWVTHAQSLKPGAAMPDLTRFSGEELRALVAYLEELE